RRLGPEQGAAGERRLDDVAQRGGGDLRHRQHAVVVRVADRHRAVEVEGRQLLRLGIDRYARDVAGALDLDRAVAVQVDAVLQVQGQEEQPAVDGGPVDAAARAVGRGEGDRSAQGQRGAGRGHEIEAVLGVD